MKATVSRVFEDLKLRQPTGQSQDNFNFGPSLLKFFPQILQSLQPSQYLDTKLGETPTVYTMPSTHSKDMSANDARQNYYPRHRSYKEKVTV